MTVKELIEELKKWDENLIVGISDSEWGTEPIGGRIKKSELTVWEGLTHYKIDGIVIE